MYDFESDMTAMHGEQQDVNTHATVLTNIWSPFSKPQQDWSLWSLLRPLCWGPCHSWESRAWCWQLSALKTALYHQAPLRDKSLSFSLKATQLTLVRGLSWQLVGLARTFCEDGRMSENYYCKKSSQPPVADFWTSSLVAGPELNSLCFCRDSQFGPKAKFIFHASKIQYNSIDEFKNSVTASSQDTGHGDQSVLNAGTNSMLDRTVW